MTYWARANVQHPQAEEDERQSEAEEKIRNGTAAHEIKVKAGSKRGSKRAPWSPFKVSGTVS